MTCASADNIDGVHFSTDPSPEDIFCSAVVHADQVIDDLTFETCVVDGDDTADVIASLHDSLGHEDTRYLLVSDIVPV